MLKNATDFDSYDPQRVYTGEDLAFFGATIQRALVAYKYSPDPGRGHHPRSGHGDRHRSRQTRTRRVDVHPA